MRLHLKQSAPFLLRKGKSFEEYNGKERALQIRQKMSLARAQCYLELGAKEIERLHGVKLGKVTASFGSINDLKFAREVLVLKEKNYSYLTYY